MQSLTWVKNERNAWFRLLDLDITSIVDTGVYVVWHGGFPSRVVHVGWGELSHEMAARRMDPRVRAYLEIGPLFVTWAVVDADAAEGVCRHLEETLRPLVPDGPYASEPIAANSPF